MANRHLLRTIALQSLFEWDFHNREGNLTEIIDRTIDEFAGGSEDNEFAHQLVSGVTGNIEKLDGIIVKTAPDWPISQITIIDRNVLRLGIYELMIAKNTPPKVAINEAVEMGKRFGGDASGKFVNGVLGTLYKTLAPEDKKSDDPGVSNKQITVVEATEETLQANESLANLQSTDVPADTSGIVHAKVGLSETNTEISESLKADK